MTITPRSSIPRLASLLPFLYLFSNHVFKAAAQSTLSNHATMSLSSAPQPTSPVIIDPFSSDLPLPSGTSQTSSLPSSSPHKDNDNDNPQERHVFNYFFLLIALIILLGLFMYLLLARAKRKQAAQRQRNGQQALARDLERWGGGGPWGPGGRFIRSRVTRFQTRREEGLDERGEAPPPYMPKEPAGAAFPGRSGQREGGEEIALRDMAKPPDYHVTVAGPVSEPTSNGQGEQGSASDGREEAPRYS